MNRPRIMFYNDARHCHLYRYEPPMFREEYVAMVDELAGTPVEAINFTLGEGRTMLHDTRAGELMGHNVEVWDHQVFRRAAKNAKGLIDRGEDPLRILCERAAELGILIYPTLTVQGPGPDHASVRCSDFRRENQHLEIGAAGGVDPDHISFSCLDFKHPEARDERFAIVDEVVSEYDVGGFELQLNILPYYFHPDEVEAGCEIMTEWIRRVYEAVKKSGSQRELVIRIPNSIEDCLGKGMDVRGWIGEGIVDALIAEDSQNLIVVTQGTDFRPLVEAASGSDCRIYAGMHNHVDSDRLAEAPIEIMRAAATNYWAQGIDGLYLKQWFAEWPYEAEVYEKLREISDPEVMAPRDKYYFVPTATSGEGSSAQQLPVALEEGKPVTVRFTISDELERWGDAGRVHEVLLRARIVQTTEIDRLGFKLNGAELPETLLRKINRMYKMSSPRYRIFGYWFIFKLDRDHWPRTGENEFEVNLHQRDEVAIPDIILRDVELEIKYLKGKNFHRSFVDPDLGAFEHAVS